MKHCGKCGQVTEKNVMCVSVTKARSQIRNTDCFSAATSVTCRHVCISPVLSILCLRKQLQVKNDTSPSTVVHPVLLLRATRKNIFTVNTTLLILMLTSHINEAMF